MRGKAKLLGQVDALTARGRITAENPDIPKSAVILQGYFREQETSYWCGPATMKSIADADGVVKSQAQWAEILGTTRENGTYLGNINQAINSYTNWDLRAGSYVIVSIMDKTPEWFMNFYRLHVGADRSPVVNHVKLSSQYFNYISGVYGGHYQTGRGYDDGYNEATRIIKLFEPFDERDYVPGGKPSAGEHDVNYRALYDAIRARYGWIGG